MMERSLRYFGLASRFSSRFSSPAALFGPLPTHRLNYRSRDIVALRSAALSNFIVYVHRFVRAPSFLSGRYRAMRSLIQSLSSRSDVDRMVIIGYTFIGHWLRIKVSLCLTNTPPINSSRSNDCAKWQRAMAYHEEKSNAIANGSESCHICRSNDAIFPGFLPDTLSLSLSLYLSHLHISRYTYTCAPSYIYAKAHLRSLASYNLLMSG